MNDPENFISRWSRRKREAVSEEPAKAGAEDARGVEEDKKDAKADSRESGTPVPELDIASLPPIESIDAGTDISVFLQNGVPTALRHAALRRAWSADPAIRDYLGPTENFWDAAGPNGIPGFGELDPGLDVKRMVSELFGETASETAEPDPGTSAPAQVSENRETPEANGEMTTSVAQQSAPQRNDDGATQKNAGREAALQKIPRRHGSAMPE